MFRLPHFLLTLLLTTGFALSVAAADTDKLVVLQTNGNTQECSLAKKPVVTFTNNTTLSITTGEDNAQLFFGSIADLQKLIFVGGVAENTNSSSSSPATGGQASFPTIPSVSYPQPVSLLQPRQVNPPVEPVDTSTVKPVDPPVVIPNLSDAEVVFVNGDSLLYTGKPIRARLSITLNGVELSLNKDFTVEYSDNTNPGTAKVTITGTGDYEGIVTRTFTIYLQPRFVVTINSSKTEPVIGELAVNKALATFTSSFGSVSVSNYYALAGETVTLTVTPSEDYQIDKDNIQPSLTGDDPEDLGAEREYSYMVSGNDEVSLNFLFSEKPKFYDLSEAKVSFVDDITHVYTGDSIKNTCIVTYGETPLAEGVDYTLQYNNNVNAGTATVTAMGRGNYIGSATTTFTIGKAPLTIKVEDQKMTYGADITDLKYTITGFVNNEDSTVLMKQPVVTTVATVTSPVGDYSITASGAEARNYNFTYEEGAKLTVTKAMLTVKANDKMMVYGEELPELTYQIDGFVNNETTDVLTAQPVITTEATAISPVGEYAITVSGGEAQNYDFTYEESAKLTVTKAMLTVKADDKAKVYGEALPELTYQIEGFVNNESADILMSQPVVTTEATAISAVGEYAITVGDAEAANYEFTYENAVLTITARTIVGSALTLDAEKYAYTGEEVLPAVTVQCGSAALIEGTDFTVSATKNIEPGTAELTIIGKGNYEGQIDTTFVIYLKPTVEVVINDVAVEPVVGSLMNYLAPATFETEQGIIKVDNYYALAKSVVTIDVTPKPFYYIKKDDISGIELYDDDPEELKDWRSYRYYVPESGIVVLHAVFSLDSVALGIRDQYAGDLSFEVVDGQIVRVLGARETAPVSVYDTRGQQVAAEVERSDRELLVRLNRQPQGLYIIKVNNKTFKVYRK